MGQLSALVYRDNPANAAVASEAVRRYGPLGSVRIRLQLATAAISPTCEKKNQKINQYMKEETRPATQSPGLRIYHA